MATISNNVGAAEIPETKVLAIASHVVYGYVGNTMATFVMQTLGCEVAAINTVNFSNHTGYRQFTGTRTAPSEIQSLYQGLQNSRLTDFTMLLSGYTPSAAALQVVADIARDLRQRSQHSPGSFFWILDPVMGDQGRLYVSEEMVAAYKEIVREADLILPNQFELEVLTGVSTTGNDDKGTTLQEVAEAVAKVHGGYGIPHVVVTSVRVSGHEKVLHVVGSSARSDGSSRLFSVEVPVLDAFFSGTGDMFAALMVARLREACRDAGALGRKSWTCDDDVEATELPLAKAMCKVLSSMQMVLEKTIAAMDVEMKEVDDAQQWSSTLEKEDRDKRLYLAQTKAAEVRVVRNAKDLLCPENRYVPRPLGT